MSTNKVASSWSKLKDSTQVGDTDFWLTNGMVALELGILWWLFQTFAVEDQLPIIEIMPIIFLGFVGQQFFGIKARLPFFIFLSFTATAVLFPFVQLLCFWGLFFLFFGLSQLPIAIKWRTLLLLVAAGGLAALWVLVPDFLPGGTTFIPIIGSIFMFRMSAYLYDTQYEQEKATFWQKLGYFAMLPNLAITLFPVVDYKIYRQSFYQQAGVAVYQKGISWMIRGFFHLMLYRIIYYYLLPNPEQVETVGGFLWYAVLNYALILRLSGLFHFSVGVLCLFGFNLPEVFNNYFLSTGFSDLWRRINTYWRDYIMKIFYYPIYFRLRKMGKLSGMVVTIWIAFVITWLLHSYQWFWLKGSFPLRWVDVIFWAIFGIMVSASAALQFQNKKKKKKRQQLNAYLTSMQTMGKIMAMFLFMSLLWTFWTSPSITIWWGLVVGLTPPTLADIGTLFTVFLGVFVLGSLLGFLINRQKVLTYLEPAPGSRGGAFWSFLTLVPFALVVIAPQSLQLIQPFTEKPVEHLFENRLNDQDDAMLINGYYEDILLANNIASPLNDIQQGRPDNWELLVDTDGAAPTGDWRGHDLVANTQIIFKQKSFSVNSWGLRDREYALPKPANTTRIGFFGGSYVMGSGVGDDEVFDVQFEKDLNSMGSKNYEVVNFAVSGFHLLHSVYQLQTKGLDKELDYAAIVSHSVDYRRMLKTVHEILTNREPMPFPEMDTIINNYGFNVGLQWKDVTDRFRPMAEELIIVTFQHMADLCRENNIKPVFVYWPRTHKGAEPTLKKILKVVREMGFEIIDLQDAYIDVDAEDIILANYDRHPNVLGHQLIAEELFKKYADLFKQE